MEVMCLQHLALWKRSVSDVHCRSVLMVRSDVYSCTMELGVSSGAQTV